MVAAVGAVTATTTASSTRVPVAGAGPPTVCATDEGHRQLGDGVGANDNHRQGHGDGGGGCHQRRHHDELYRGCGSSRRPPLEARHGGGAQKGYFCVS